MYQRLYVVRPETLAARIEYVSFINYPIVSVYEQLSSCAELSSSHRVAIVEPRFGLGEGMQGTVKYFPYFRPSSTVSAHAIDQTGGVTDPVSRHSC